MKNQPKIDLPPNNTEQIISWAAIIISTGALIWTCVEFTALPDQIPTHFNLKGEIDDYGSRITIFTLPFTAILMVIGLTYLTKFPHTFNYIGKITPENAASEYRFARYVLRIISLLIGAGFAALNIAVIQAAHQQG